MTVSSLLPAEGLFSKALWGDSFAYCTFFLRLPLMYVNCLYCHISQYDESEIVRAGVQEQKSSRKILVMGIIILKELPKYVYTVDNPPRPSFYKKGNFGFLGGQQKNILSPTPHPKRDFTYYFFDVFPKMLFPCSRSLSDLCGRVHAF